MRALSPSAEASFGGVRGIGPRQEGENQGIEDFYLNTQICLPGWARTIKPNSGVEGARDGWTGAVGRTAQGEDVHERVDIAAGGLRARVMSWGAVLQEYTRLEGHGAPLVLGFGDLRAIPPLFRRISARCLAALPTVSATVASSSMASAFRPT